MKDLKNYLLKEKVDKVEDQIHVLNPNAGAGDRDATDKDQPQNSSEYQSEIRQLSKDKLKRLQSFGDYM